MMNQCEKRDKNFRLFISYSHEDNKDNRQYIERFKKHISLLKDSGLISEWYDRNILPGDEYEEKIETEMEKADIICLFLSANFFASENCKKEKRKACELKKKKNIPIIPIILSYCSWLDDAEINKYLALPIDGKPVDSFEDENQAWQDIYKGLQKIIKRENFMNQLKITEDFQDFLNDAGMLQKAHSQKETINLKDIFIFPDLDKIDIFNGDEKRINSEDLINEIYKYPKIVISGEDQSGKTTLCKKIFIELRERNFIPVYISDISNRLQGKMNQIIIRFLEKEYENININEIDEKKIVPIIDDFHYTLRKEKQLTSLLEYPFVIMTIDDIYSMNISEEKILGIYTQFRIRELKPSKRSELIKKWINISDKKIARLNEENYIYEELDKAVELINSTLGKIFGSGIMPSYPFFILTIVSTYETSLKPINEEISSQGYCYQALIYLYLRKQNVRNEDIDIYINFSTEFAYYLFSIEKDEISLNDFNDFMDLYVEKFNLPIKQDVLIDKLQRIQILKIDSFNNYSFSYPYLYYYFVGKYFAEHLRESEKGIIKLMNNLHVNENAYILIFMSHHSKDPIIIKNLIKIAKTLYVKLPPVTLSKLELKFFDEQIENIIDTIRPINFSSPEKQREFQLKILDEEEEEEKIKSIDNEEKNELIEIEIRRAVRTVEVMGQIIKNRSGSLERKDIEIVFLEGMKVHLRLLSHFFKIIKDKEMEHDTVLFITERLKTMNKTKNGQIHADEIESISRKLYWNINFFTIYGIIDKIIHSLGSDKLVSIIENCCDNENYPAALLIKHGIIMWYTKNLQFDKIRNIIKNSNNSEITRRIMKFMIINHCLMHKISFKDRQKVDQLIGMSSRQLEYIKEKDMKEN